MIENETWLEYSGQSTAELLACKTTHRADSILCAFEWGLQAKEQQDGPETINSKECVILALMALDREVNNGGYAQFFANSSVRFTPIIVDCLKTIECSATAAITEKAIALLKLTQVSAEDAREAMYAEDEDRDAALNQCDNEFYQLCEIGENLFSFVELHQNEIQLAKEFIPYVPEPIPAGAPIGTMRELMRDLKPPEE